jgi:hypothetical protein
MTRYRIALVTLLASLLLVPSILSPNRVICLGKRCYPPPCPVGKVCIAG